MKKKAYQSNTITNMALASIISTIIIISRLFYLQVYNRNQYATQSEKNYIRYESISAARGQILDCHNKKLVTNRPLMNLYWHGTGNRLLNEEQRDILQQLAQITPLFSCDQQTINALHRAEKRNEQLLLLQDIDYELLSKIEELCGAHINIYIKHDFKRYYPHAELACHVIGYLSNIPQAMGKMGLEKQLQDTLQGKDGMLLKTINSYGKKIEIKALHQETYGNDINVTLDLGIQKLVEEALSDTHSGTFIIMDPKDGGIKALCSRPSFDPSLFLDPIDHATWHTLQNKRPFLNRAMQCAYPPGSLFKLITISAALEHAIVQPDDTFICKGYTEFSKRRYSCNKKTGHGKLTIKQALALSCNPLFYELAQQLPIDVLADYAHRFGLGQSTGCMLPEQTGLIPTSAWKQQQYGERWWPGETLSAAIGQSYLLATPIQIARMVSSIFTGYLVRPRILVDEPIETVPLNIQPDTLQFLQESMRSVVTEGTGHRISRLKDIAIHAKTSTAQMSTMAKRTLGKEFLEHGWVVAHFAYKNQDPLVMVILVEHAGSSRVPMIIAKDFLLAYRKLLAA